MKKALSILALVFLLNACGASTSDTTEETGQQVGDVMASVDEGGGSAAGAFALQATSGYEKTLARLSPPSFFDSWKTIPEAQAQATACSASTFSTCAANVMTRTLSSCSIGSAVLSGNITLNFTDAAVDTTCSLATAGHSVARTPTFTVTGRRGATLTVSKTGTHGQVITKGSGSTFTFSNDGIRRVFTSASGATSLDFTTTTTSNITITGTSRTGRTMTGGNLRVTNNSTNVTCDFVPSSVTWAANCNCATSGSWSGTCSDGKTSSVSITGCGTATVTIGTSSTTVTFDRCFST